ncbi:MAG TPA: pilus assembly protein PilM [Pirellulales bacterium]|nr:pilus assembly protein PilM [Pirellulales bacterium]
MAKTNAVWGIDIGQCALKALRCRAHDQDDLIVADAFDYIEYPKILSQPDADPAELVREALELFLSRNSVRGDRVAISVSGQSGLARFIKLPPVESKKIPDIVKYEARQQIPFALEDVVWDYQQMDGGSEEDGFALETEVGLFAMKRDQVFRALKPFEDADIEVDVIQLTPLTIYNYTVFDQMQDLPPADQYDPDNPPESVVVLSLGTDTTDLVVTNGYRVWQRSVPLGGSHFTKSLTKELRLTFTKAEHLKKHATQADDPKAVFQAMRPVFNDLLTEIQRSIGYFTSMDRGAKIGRVIALGNAMRLPGLQKYLSQNLGYAVSEVQSYRGISGDAVTSAPAFKDNLLSFAVCYGLVLQGLAKSKLSTNLLPHEIVTDRLIRDKKPWAVAMVAALMLGCAVSFLGHWRAWNSVAVDKFKGALGAAKQTEDTANQDKANYDLEKTAFTDTNKLGTVLVGDAEGRMVWLELLKALDQCLPSDPPDKRPDDIEERRELHIKEFNCEWYSDLGPWYNGAIAERIARVTAEMGASAPKAEQPAAAAPGAAVPGAPLPGAVPPGGSPPNPGLPSTAPPPGLPGATLPAGAPGMPPPGGGDPNAAAGAAPLAAPTGPGWVIQLRGYHYHNKHLDASDSTTRFVRDTLIKQLREGKVKLAGKDGKDQEVSVKDLGIGYPVIVSDEIKFTPEEHVDPNAGPPKPGPDGKPTAEKTITLKRFDFTVQFVWQPTTRSKRLEIQEQRAKAQNPSLASDAAAAPMESN